MKQIIKKNQPLILILFVVVGFFLFFGHKTTTTLSQTPVVAAVSQLVIPSSETNKSLLADLTPTITTDRKPAVEKGLYVPILMYHHVGYLGGTEQGIKYDQTAVDLTVSPQDFELQIQYFKESGYVTVSLAQVYDAAEFGNSLPAHPIIFTFDDGYKDVFVNAIPVLQKYGYTGTFAVATELLGRPSYGTWDDVLAARKLGMEIISHTENHLDLINPIYSDKDLYREIINSKILLEQTLGVPIDFFVYPYGHYNQKVVDLVKIAGYKMALTTAFGVYVNQDSLLETPRVRVHGQEGLAKLKKIFARFD